jgi:hypothetical protein
MIKMIEYRFATEYDVENKVAAIEELKNITFELA